MIQFLILLVFLIPQLQAKRVIITGGAGLIGSHLCQELLNQNNEVICLDNLSSGNIQNITCLLCNPKFSFIKHDICIPFQIDMHIDEIFNLACPASPIYYQIDPIQTLKTNFIGTLNMLELARVHQAKFLHTSTSEVYGDPLVHPQKEEYWGNVNSIGIRACYDEGKRAAEALIFAYRNTHGIDTKIVRIFNTYGPYMSKDDGRVISNFVVQALHNKPLTIYGNGMQTRSICYVSDTVNGLIKMMTSSAECCGPINLGNPNEMTILEIAQKIISLTESSSELIFQPLPQDDPKKRQPDISKARKILHWEPEIDAETGLLKTISYFKNAEEDS